MSSIEYTLYFTIFPRADILANMYRVRGYQMLHFDVLAILKYLAK